MSEMWGGVLGIVTGLVCSTLLLLLGQYLLDRSDTNFFDNKAVLYLFGPLALFAILVLIIGFIVL